MVSITKQTKKKQSVSTTTKNVSNRIAWIIVIFLHRILYKLMNFENILQNTNEYCHVCFSIIDIAVVLSNKNKRVY